MIHRPRPVSLSLFLSPSLAKPTSGVLTGSSAFHACTIGGGGKKEGHGGRQVGWLGACLPASCKGSRLGSYCSPARRPPSSPRASYSVWTQCLSETGAHGRRRKKKRGGNVASVCPLLLLLLLLPSRVQVTWIDSTRGPGSGTVPIQRVRWAGDGWMGTHRSCNSPALPCLSYGCPDAHGMAWHGMAHTPVRPSVQNSHAAAASSRCGGNE